MLSGPNDLHLSSRRIVRNNVSSAQGPALVGVFGLVNVKRGTNDNFSIVHRNYLFTKATTPRLRIFSSPKHIRLALCPHGVTKSSVVTKTSTIPKISTSNKNPINTRSPAVQGSRRNANAIREVNTHKTSHLGSVINAFNGGITLPTSFNGTVEPRDRLRGVACTLAINKPRPASCLTIILKLNLAHAQRVLTSLIGSNIVRPVNIKHKHGCHLTRRANS